MITAMGFIVQPDISEYWTTNDINGTHFFVNTCQGIVFGCACPFYTWLIMIFRRRAGHNTLFKLGESVDKYDLCLPMLLKTVISG